MNEREALILLNSVEGLGPVRIRRLLDRFHSPQTIFGATASELVTTGLPETVARSLLQAPGRIALEDELASVQREEAKIVTFLDEEYPKPLKEIHDFPVVLYVKGEFRLDEALFFAIVGSRRASPYGLDMAERIARELVGYGFTIVSGFARGIDTAAHRGALKAEGRTVAVLGSGLLEIYPPENRTLAKEVFQRGAMISEFPLRTPPFSENFPRRNRVISGLSLGVLVVEADERSGALITANAAMEQNREVFALPGRIDSSLSRGTHRLIQQGAKLLQDPTDILEELKIPIANGITENSFVTRPAPFSTGKGLNRDEAVVYEALSDHPKSIDAIVEEARLSAQAALSTLVQLEVKKLVRAYPGKYYVRN